MSRQTFTQLQNSSKDMISQSSGSFNTSTVANFVKEYLNKGYRVVQSKLRGYIMRDLPQTASTVADQQRYHYPPNVYPPIASATLEIGGVDYPLDVIHSQIEWDSLNQVDYSGTTIPQYIFPMRDHFELWPIPASSGDTITLVNNAMDDDMVSEDVTTGTVTVTNNDPTITHSGTSFTASMVGMWFQTDDDQTWYRIASFTSTSSMELETAFAGTTAAGASFTIGESPEIPPEIHEILPHYVAQAFYAGPRKDFTSAQSHNNFFYTGDYINSSRRLSTSSGGLLGAVKLYSRRSDSKVINKNRGTYNRFNEGWSSTLSSTI